MKKFSRCMLIWILVTILCGIGSIIYENSTITPMYDAVAKLYVVPGANNEASIRAKHGGLNDDFMIIFKSDVVISAAQKIAGTTEDIAEYLTVTSPENSNIVELKITNPDANTAVAYVDAVAKTAIKTTSIIPVESIQILSSGEKSGDAYKPDLMKKAAYLTVIGSAICLFAELIVCLALSAFKREVDNSDDEYDYERKYGKYAESKNKKQEKTIKFSHEDENIHKTHPDDILSSYDNEKEESDLDKKLKNALDNNPSIKQDDFDEEDEFDAAVVDELVTKNLTEEIDDIEEDDEEEESIQSKIDKIAEEEETIDDVPETDIQMENSIREDINGLAEEEAEIIVEETIETTQEDAIENIVEDEEITEEVAATSETKSKVKIIGRIRK